MTNGINLAKGHQKSSLTKMTMTENDHNTKKTGSPLMERA